MQLRIKRNNLRRLASLSALGAGAIAATSTAEADIVLVNVNETVPSPTDLAFIPLPGGSAGFTLHAGTIFTGGAHFVTYTHFRVTKTAILGPYGGARLSSGRAFRLATRRYSYVTHRVITSIGFPTFRTTRRTLLTRAFSDGGLNGYLSFHFPDNGKTLYGWADFATSVSATSGPDLTFINYAYDTTGARIAPGQTSSVPEPSEAIPVALSALVLGAAGVRRWRAAQGPRA